MTNWPVKTLGEVCEVVNGATPDTKVREYWGGRHAWITPAEMGNLDSPFLSMSRRSLSDEGLASCSATLVPPKTVILSSRAPIGHLVINEVPMATNQGCKSLIPREGLDFNFLYYYLKMNVELLDSLGTGTTFKELSGAQLKTVEIPVPPLEEQKRIVALLDEATARVTELTACYEQARTHANDLFTSALRGALEGNPDWPIKSLGDICEVFDDGDWIESKDQASSGVRLIQTGNVGDGEFKDRSDKARFISEPTFSRLRCTEIFPGDLLVSRLPDPVGRACLIPETGSKMITAVDCTIMRPRKEIMLAQFLVLSTQTSGYREQVRAKITGTTRDRISRSNLAEVQVAVPPLDEQKRIVSRLDSMKAKTTEMVGAYDAKLAAAKNLRQSILEAAFAGEL
jgi:type I restriction enzyme S subunit